MAKTKSSNKQVKQHKSGNDAFNSFKVVLFYCLLIIFSPIVTYFVTKVIIFDGFMNLEPIRSNICSAVSAIITLHVALGIYITKAYLMDEDTIDTKQD